MPTSGTGWGPGSVRSSQENQLGREHLPGQCGAGGGADQDGELPKAGGRHAQRDYLYMTQVGWPASSRPPKVSPALSTDMAMGKMTRRGQQDPGATEQSEETEDDLSGIRKPIVFLNSKNLAKKRHHNHLYYPNSRGNDSAQHGIY